MISISARLAFRSLPELGSWTTAGIRLLAVPIAMGLFYLALASGGGSAAVDPSDAVAAAAGVGAVSAAVATSSMIAHDRFESTLGLLVIATHHRAEMWMGRFLVLGGMGLLASCATAIVTLLIVQPVWTAAQWLGLLPVLLLASLSSIGFGFFLGALSLYFKDAFLLTNAAEFTLPIVCGVVAPISVFPQAMSTALFAIPATGAIEAGRVLANGEAASWLPAATLSLFMGGLFLAAGVLLWSVLERQARQHGTIDSVSI